MFIFQTKRNMTDFPSIENINELNEILNKNN